MNKEVEKKLKVAISMLNTIDGYFDYSEKYSKENKITNSNDFFTMLDRFAAFLSSKGKLDEMGQLIIANVKEISEKLIYHNSTSKIFVVNNTLKPKEEYIEDFFKEFNGTRTDDIFFEKIKPRRYKTITEKNALLGVDGEKLTVVLNKYNEFNHPYIYYLLSEPLINSKNFSQGIPILNKALKYAFRYPNYFWHSCAGIDGCTWSLFSIQRLLGMDGIGEISKEIPFFWMKLLKLTYLYLSRYIYMSGNNIKSIDFYSNRARLVKNYYSEFVVIFGIGVNPDIQYISDNYLAYEVSCEFGLSGLPPFMDLMFDSLKMYEHGSHIPNTTGGYKEIEDRTWMELVRDGKIRSIIFAERFLSEYENYEYNLNNSEVDFVCNYAINKNKDDFENYIEKLKKKK